MGAPVRHSGSRLVHSPPRTGAQGRANATTIRHSPPPTTPKPYNPHLADYSQTQKLRTQISQQARNYPSLYGTLVSKVDGVLQKHGFGISPASYQSVMRNLKAVNQGTMSQSTAHFRESKTFAQDAVASFTHHRFVQGGVEAFGAAANLIGGVTMSNVESVQHLAQGAQHLAEEALHLFGH